MKKKIYVVTGASSGFGKEFARVIMEQGDFAVVTMRHPEQVEAFNKRHDGKGFAIQLDITNAEHRDYLVKTVINTYGHVDVLVNNAGCAGFGAAEEFTYEQRNLIMQTNYFGPVELTNAFLPFMREAFATENRKSSIVFMSSIAAQVPAPGLSAYNETKAALESFGLTLAREVACFGISVLAVKPGPFRTKWAGSGAVIGARQIEAYDNTKARQFPRMMQEEWNGNQPGDPEKAVKLVLEVLNDEKHPNRLVLGEMGHQLIADELEAFKADLEYRKREAINTDYNPPLEEKMPEQAPVSPKNKSWWGCAFSWCSHVDTVEANNERDSGLANTGSLHRP